MELRNYALKFIFFAFFATFSAAFGWSSGVAAAQPNALIKALNNADRAFCRSLKTKCKTRAKSPAAQRQKLSTEKPPIPVQKPLVVEDVAAPAPIPREKPQNLQKQAALQPEVLPGDTQSGKVDKLASAPRLPTQSPVIAPKAGGLPSDTAREAANFAKTGRDNSARIASGHAGARATKLILVSKSFVLREQISQFRRSMLIAESAMCKIP